MRLQANTTDSPVLVGGWFRSPKPVSFCPEVRALTPWSPCLLFYLYERPAGPVGENQGGAGWAYGHAPNEAMAIYPGAPAQIDQSTPYAITRSVVLSVHTHDKACPATYDGCSSQAVLGAIVWLGSPGSPGPTP